MEVGRLKFYNTRNTDLTLSQVLEEIKSFISADPENVFRLAFGTDSQVIRNKHVFVIAIHIHKVGKGCWGCICKIITDKKADLKEKIEFETGLTRNLAALITNDWMDQLEAIIYPHSKKGAALFIEAHLDVGYNGRTRKLINEMVANFSDNTIEIKIKPYAYAASSYANKHSKKI